jgi:hypothetical protein
MVVCTHTLLTLSNTLLLNSNILFVVVPNTNPLEQTYHLSFYVLFEICDGLFVMFIQSQFTIILRIFRICCIWGEIQLPYLGTL